MTQAKPRPKFQTIEEYIAYEGAEEDLYELAEGQLIPVTSEPRPNSRISLWLAMQFAQIFGIDNVCHKDTEIEVRKKSASTKKPSTRKPDVMVLGDALVEALESMPKGVIPKSMPAPLLVIEVVSPGEENELRDYNDKRLEYAAWEIPEYWIIDPGFSEIRVLELSAGKYETMSIYRGRDRVRSSLEQLTKFDATVEQILSAGKLG